MYVILYHLDLLSYASFASPTFMEWRDKSSGVCANGVTKMVRSRLTFQTGSYSISQRLAFPRDMKGVKLKSKVWKPCLSLSLISSSKQMRESIWDESKSLALSLPLRVTRVIHLQCSIWRGSQTLPWTPPPFPLPLELLWIKRLSFIPPTIPAVWCLVFWAHCVMEIKRRLSGANRHLYKWGFSPVHTLYYCQSKMN